MAQFKEKIHIVYEIESIIARRLGENGTEYNIKWKDYPNDDNTWEPLNNLISDGASELIYVFELQSKEGTDHDDDVEEFLRKYKQIRQKNKEISKNSDGEDEEIEEEWMSNMGSLPKDSIKRIIKLEKHFTNNDLYALVEWNARSIDGIKPKDSYVKSSKLKKYYLQKYLDFLEGMMYTDK